MKAITLSIVAALACASGTAMASMEMAKAKNCTACHAVDKKLIGPAYKDVAAKYANDKEAPARLVDHVRKGSTGVWGQIPMPANPQVTQEEAETLVKWILEQK